MSSKKPVVIYGVTGYTGRLVAEYLREYRTPFIAAGRDAKRIREVLDKVPGIENAEYDIVEVEHTTAALTELFSGAKVVCNMVGPFMKYGPEAVEAAYAAGCHYTDTNGEQNWMMWCEEHWGAKYAERQLLLSPGIAQMYTTGEIAANLCLETPGLDTLDILVLWRGFPTYASTQTIFSILTADFFYLEQNQYVQWAPTARAEYIVPGQHEVAMALPWGGTAHPVWFKNDPRVANVKAMGGVFDRTVMEGVVQITSVVEEQIKKMPKAEQEKALSDMAASLQAGMPPRENQRINTSVDSVHASGPLGRVHCVIHGTCNYKQTGLMQAYAAYHLLQAPPKRYGFASGCQAFGHRELLGVLQSFGLASKPIMTHH
ncbi:DUF5938 domain-containing protein [Flagellatimonas centrodinii]|uniref:DUF5938 domain-containing protein n=1 Tax=Flagellatimonas centrodinii TaxID=2806210 RepID=UPI001FEEE069|nr:DUF5938 domain-containing protein [Flagellatimonas centrodinii]ULQ46517.1 DUF5938 domain-containing protein [Flagellatimonas centrodinii]